MNYKQRNENVSVKAKKSQSFENVSLVSGCDLSIVYAMFQYKANTENNKVKQNTAKIRNETRRDEGRNCFI